MTMGYILNISRCHDEGIYLTSVAISLIPNDVMKLNGCGYLGDTLIFSSTGVYGDKFLIGYFRLRKKILSSNQQVWLLITLRIVMLRLFKNYLKAFALVYCNHTCWSELDIFFLVKKLPIKILSP